MKRILSFILAVAMVFSLLPVTVLAQEEPDASGTPGAAAEGTPTPEATPEEEPEGDSEGDPEGEPEGEPEGAPEGSPEGEPEGDPEGAPEGDPEGDPEGAPEVPEVAVETVTVTAEDNITALLVTEELQLYALVLPEDATHRDVVWSSSDETVATVSDRGLVTALAVGTVSIRATAGGITGSIELTVSLPEHMPSIASTVLYSGSCGENVAYTITDDGVMTFTGSGAMTNAASQSKLPWYSVDKSLVHTVVVDEGITGLTNYAFYGFTNLSSVDLPQSLTVIGDSAFRECAALTGVKLPDGLTSIGTNAFRGCTALTEIVIPDGMTSLSLYAFAYCSALQTITLPASLVDVTYEAFYNSPVTTIHYGGTVAQWRDICFAFDVTVHCTDGTILCCNDSGAAIQYVLMEDGTLTITGTGEMGGYSTPAWFGHKDQVTSVYVGEGITGLKPNSFSDMPNLTRVELPSTFLALPGSAFSGCTGLTEIEIPDSVTSIGAHAFSGCTGLTKITIPEGVTTIGNRAFSGCTGLTELIIPGNVTSLGEYVFSGCTGLTHITIPSGITALSLGMFSGCTGLGSVTLPENLTALAESAFSGCTALRSIDLPAGITVIPESAFSGAGITSIAIPAGVTLVDHWAFSSCASLQSITFLGSSVAEIGNYCFMACSSLNNVQLPAGLLSLGYYAFGECKGLTHIELPDGVTTLDDNVFMHCSNLQSATIGEGLTRLPSIFNDCPNLAQLQLPASLTEIHEFPYSKPAVTFAGTMEQWMAVINNGKRPAVCADGTLLGFGNAGEDITFTVTGDGALTLTGTGATAAQSPWNSSLNSVITSVSLDSRITAIGDNFFSYCTALTSVTLPEGVESIGAYSFRGCSALEEVILPQSLQTVGSGAFNNCNALTELQVPVGVVNFASDAVGKNTRIRYAGTMNQWINLFSSGYMPAVCSDGELLSFGSCGENIQYTTVREGDRVILRISGIGKMLDDMSFPNRAEITDIVVDEGVETVGSNAFRNFYSLEQVTLPATLTAIGYRAFYGCDSLAELPLPEGLLSLGDEFIRDCDGLLTIHLPGSLTHVSSLAMDGSCCNNVSYGGTVEDCIALGLVYSKPIVCSDGTVLRSGSCGATASYYLLEGGSMLVTGTGAVSSGYDHGNRSEIIHLIVSEGITDIGYSAFSSCSNLESVILTESVTAIGTSAFSYCYKLKTVTIPASVTTIGDQAFGYCDALTTVTFGHTAEDPLTLGASCFWNSSVNISPLLIRVPYARAVNPALLAINWEEDARRTVTYESTGFLPATAVTISCGDVWEIEAGLELPLTFQVTPGAATSNVIWTVQEESTGSAIITADGILTGLEPGTVTVRGTSTDDAAVYDELTVTILPPTAEAESVSVVSGGEFPNEAEVGTRIPLTAKVYPGNTADKSVTWDVVNGTGTATITEDGILTALTAGTVTVYAETANGCIGSYTVNIVRYAEDITIVLNGDPALRTFAVGETVYLTAQILPGDVSNTGINWSVEGDNGAKVRSVSGGVYALTVTQPGTVVLTAASKDSRAAAVSLELSFIDILGTYALPDGSGNLYYNTQTGVITDTDATVVDVVIPGKIGDTVITGIAPFAFANVDSYYYYVNTNNTLRSVVIPASVTEIGYYAFGYCRALTTLRFSGSGSLREIGHHAFYDCDALTSVTIPASVRTIGNDAFYGCDAIATLVIPDTVTQIGEDAFGWLSGLKHLTVSGEWDTSSFLSYNGVLESVTLTGSRVIGKRVEQGTIYSMPGRSACRVTIADTVTQIDPYAFHWENDMVQITLGDGLESIGSYAFQDCDSLESIVIPEGVTSIGAYAFERCDELETVVLPESLQRLEEGAFCGCDALSSLNLPGGLRYVGKDCFEGTDKLDLLSITKLPDTLVEPEYSLAGCGSVPAVLVSATGGKTELDWYLHPVEEGAQDPYEFVGMYWMGGDTAPTIAILGEGTFKLVCYDRYTGARGSRILTAKSGAVITPSDTEYLIAGQKLQFSLKQMPSGQKLDANWSLAPGDEAYATLTASGLLTAGNVNAAHQIRITATPKSGGDSVTMTLWILPKATGMVLYAGDIPVGESGTALQTLDVDMAEGAVLPLRVTAEPEGALTDLNWTSSAAAIASVDSEGNVTLHKTGTVTIKAAARDGSGKYVSVKLNIYFLDTAKTLTARAEVPTIGLQPGQSTQMLVFGSDQETPIPADRLTFSIPSNMADVASVDALGNITAGTKPGTVTVTARLTGDPLNRSITAKVKVIGMQAQSLEVVPTAQTPGQVVMLDDTGSQVEDPALCAGYAVVLNMADLNGGSYTFTASAIGTDYMGQTWTLAKSAVRWSSTDTSLATVAAQADGSVLVTVKPGVSGECAIRGTTTDLAKISCDLWVIVRDYAPRLETKSLTLNSNLEEGVAAGFAESYGNTVTALRLYEYDNSAKAYSTAPSQRLEAVCGNGTLTVRSLKTLTAGTYKLLLEADCLNGETYTYELTVKVVNKLPTVTVKQSGRFNLFYTDSTTSLALTVKGEQVLNVTLANTDSFRLEYDPESGECHIFYTDAYLEGSRGKPDTGATLQVYLAGYHVPVTKAITISTTTAKPTLAMTPTASIINTALSQPLTAQVQVMNKTEGSLIWLDEAQVEVLAPFAEATVCGDTLLLDLLGTTGGTAAVYVQAPNWLSPIKLTHKVTVQSALPTLKLGATTLKLNRYFTLQTAATSATLSQSNLDVAYMDFRPTAAEGTALWEQADKLQLDYDPDTRSIVASFKDPEDAPKAGTYSFHCDTTLTTGDTLKRVTVRVNVAATLPTVKLTTATLKLNRNLAGYEAVSTGLKITGGTGYEVVDFEELSGWDHEFIGLEFVDGVLSVSLNDSGTPTGKYALKLTPVLLHTESGQYVTLPTALTLNVQVYGSNSLGVSISAKGKLDTMDSGSAIVYTVSKYTNCSGPVDGVSLAGEHADLFHAELDTSGSKPTVTLTMLPGVSYSTATTYKVQLVFSICGRDVASRNLTFRVSQSKLTISAPKRCVFFQSQSHVLEIPVTLTAPGGAAIHSVSLGSKTTATLRQTLGADGIRFELSEDGRTATVYVDIARPGLLGAGKSYTLCLDVTPENCAENQSAAQVSVTVQIKR